MLATFRTILRSSSSRSAERAGEDGFLLIEVVISALLVALIVIATLTGFDVVNRATAEQRRHADAALLAGASQEQLRSDPASTLDQLLGATALENAHVYTQTVGGTTFTITQEVESKTGTNETAGCTTGTTKASAGVYLQVASYVTWPLLKANKKRPEVSQSSIITPPDGSGLEVDVTNGAKPESPVSGVTAVATYEGEKTEQLTTIEGTTGSAGCVLFAGIPSTAATVEAYRTNYVTPSGAYIFGPKETSITPNLTTHEPVELAEGGAIEAEFQYNKVGVPSGDTFVVENHSIAVAPEFEVGSPEVAIESNGTYNPLLKEKYAETATTAISSAHYAKGDLFPFPTSWSVYAGDCPANNVESVTGGTVKGGSIAVGAGVTSKVAVPMSKVKLLVYEGTKATPGSLANSLEVKITNLGCSKASTPNNASKAIYVHTQKTNSKGELEDPYQPFGTSFKLCVYGGASHKNSYTTEEYALTKETGFTAPTIYLGETTIPSITIVKSVSSC